jgi:hypothetical protein
MSAAAQDAVQQAVPQLAAAEAAEAASTGVSPEMFTVNNTWMMVSIFLVFIMHLGFATM